MILVLRCTHCGQKNRTQVRAGAKCGRCKGRLAEAITDAIMAAADARRAEWNAGLRDELQMAADAIAERARSAN